jgi:signal transduction histidine kinase
VEDGVRRAAQSGLDVRLRLEGEREGLPAGVVEAACRVVQESLTNALRYASGAKVQVLVCGEPEALLVEVANGAATAERALAGAGTGNGLRGLHERVAACGGRLVAGPVHGGGWSVSARLPRRAPVPAAPAVAAAAA